MILTTPIPQTIKFSPADWRWATWRPYTPLPREIPPFDQEAAIAKLSKARGTYDFSWSNLHLSPILSRSEAHFWLEGLSYAAQSWQNDAKKTALFVADKTYNGDLSLIAIESILSGISAWRTQPEIVIPLVNLLSPIELVNLLNKLTNHQKQKHHSDTYTAHLVRGFQDYVVPYLTEDERAQIRNTIRDDVAQATILTNRTTPDFCLFAAAALGRFSGELEKLSSALPDNFYQLNISTTVNSYYYFYGIDLMFGFNDPTAVEREARRLDHLLCLPHQVIGWIAHTETKALDWVYTSIVRSSKELAAGLFRVLTQVEDEAVVPFMLKLRNDGPVQMQAIEWLSKHPEVGARGAAAVFAMGGTSGTEARTYLRTLKSKGHLDLLNTIQLNGAQDRFREEVIDYVEETLPPLTPADTPAWLADAVAALQADQKKKRVKLPAWLDADELPPLSINGRALTREHIEALLVALSRSTLETVHPLVKAIHDHIDVMIRDAFAWKLFELWSERGASSKDKWALMAVGLLGGDASVMKLTPLIRKWPGEAQHQRAVLGLNCLRMIGTDTALTQINNIGQKVQFKALKTAAQTAIQGIAAERGMSSEQLADRIVPDCGLDDDGRRTFDYGARQFTLVINSDLKPMIRGEDNKLKPDLPKPNSSDDPEKATIAQAEWKLIKKQVRDVAKLQGVRLENAMMARRTWMPDEFRTLLVDHPLMIHLVKSLIWGGFDADRKLVKTFRVTDEKDYADSNDDPITLDGVVRIGLVHPLQVSSAEIAAWGQVLSDYDRMPAFVQLSRKTYALEPDERDATEITRYKDVKIEAVVLMGVLQKLGWLRGRPADAGMYYEHAKPFPDDNVTAIVEYDGLPIGYLQGWQDQSIERCFFVPGVYAADQYYPKHSERLKLGTIDPVVMSEVLRDLALLSHKGGK